MPRARLLAGLLAIATLAGPLTLGTVARAAPATQQQGARTVVVSETTDLPDTDAGLTVNGSGFDPAADSYVAVCGSDSGDTDPLSACLGGAVPDDNDTASWAVVTSEPDGKQNAIAYAAGGSFRVDLTLTSASSGAVDCLTTGCVLLVRSAAEGDDRPEDIAIPLTFAAAPSSQSESSQSTTSEAPSTVGPDSVALPDAYLGQQQTVVFSGFTPDEPVAVTVFSEPQTIDGVTASPGGVVAITFPVGEALVPGVHTVQAIGQQSGVIGIANFTVVEAPVTTTSTTESSSSASETSSAAVTTAAPTSETTSSAAVTTSEETTTGEVTPVQPSGSGGSLWWLWVTLVLLVVAIAVAVAVTASRRRAQQLEQERLDREQELADLAAATPPTWAGGTGAPYTSPADRPDYRPYGPDQSYGLLSGRQGDGPALYSGQGLGDDRDEPPTRWIDTDDRSADLPTTAIRPDGAGRTTPPGGTGPVEPPATRAFDPSTAGAGDADGPDAPRTEQWSPFGDEDEGDGEPPRRR